MLFNRDLNESPWQLALKIFTKSIILVLGFSALRNHWSHRNTNPVYCTLDAPQDFINDARTTFDYLHANACKMPDTNFKALQEVQPTVLNSFIEHLEITATKDDEQARITQNPGIGRTMRGVIMDRNHPMINEIKPKDDKTSVFSRLFGKGGEFCHTIYQSVCEQPKSETKINIPKRSFNM